MKFAYGPISAIGLGFIAIKLSAARAAGTNKAITEMQNLDEHVVKM